MRSIYNRSAEKTDAEIYDIVLKFNGEIDTYREMKFLEDYHPLSQVSDRLDDYLSSIDKIALKSVEKKGGMV